MIFFQREYRKMKKYKSIKKKEKNYTKLLVTFVPKKFTPW